MIKAGCEVPVTCLPDSIVERLALLGSPIHNRSVDKWLTKDPPAHSPCNGARTEQFELSIDLPEGSFPESVYVYDPCIFRAIHDRIVPDSTKGDRLI